MSSLKIIYKRNSHNFIFRLLAGLGRAVNRLYENRNHQVESNGELTVVKKIATISPKVIIDGGANIGKYSLLLNKYNPDSKIYAFEPVEDTCSQLTENVKHLKNIFPINKGLFSENCVKEINLFKSNTHSSVFDIKGISYNALTTVQINLVKGDTFTFEENISEIDFLKLDVEGAEYEAIIGFENLLKAHKIKVIQFEYGYINISTKKLLIDFYSLLESYGYILGKIYPKTVEFRTYKYKHEDFIGPNFLAVSSNYPELIKLFSAK